MQLWFWAAVSGAVLAGISNFCFKVAAKRNYGAELFSFYGGATSVLFATAAVIVSGHSFVGPYQLALITVFAGAVATMGGIMKVYALRHIDSTIFFPLFKLFGPLLAIMAGVLFLSERFSYSEWMGMFLGLTVPLLLITKVEKERQSNLMKGLLFVALISMTSALAAFFNKYVIDAGLPEVLTLLYSSVGIFIGVLVLMLQKIGYKKTVEHIIEDTSKGLLLYSSLRAALICMSMLFILYAYGHGGTLGVVQTIHSMYILIPIVLAIIFYNEHWNLQKAVAIVLSVAALAFLH